MSEYLNPIKSYHDIILSQRLKYLHKYLYDNVNGCMCTKKYTDNAYKLNYGQYYG